MISVKGIGFSYTKKPFIENVSFNVGRGEIFGFLGPSGAGKSTLQKILAGVLRNYSGSVIVNGTEVKKHNHTFYENIGVDFEFPSLYEKLTAVENLKFYSSLYAKATTPIPKLLDMVGLNKDGNKKVSAYSKGMKSRLNFIKALLHNPDILFLDEPTSGLDPSNVAAMKDIIKAEKAKGKTVILTTHNMYDATELCDRVAFFVDGKIKAMDTPHNLIMSKGGDKLHYTYMANETETKNTISLNKTCEDAALLQLLKDNKITSIHSTEPTLNDIFVDITGRRLA
jgi:fluoroquinolone transport system ATP-binding protein